MITEHVGEAALPDLEDWANAIIRSEDDTVKAMESYHDADSNTYVIRLTRDARVLLFRLSEAQVHTPGREPECEKTLRNRVKEVRRLLGR
ncbi:MAG: hypothetical protein OXE53_11555 [Deltaproteobacteria bacterium]|nr:hypothetical protein [Deltaproteobacteria bacterium]